MEISATFVGAVDGVVLVGVGWAYHDYKGGRHHVGPFERCMLEEREEEAQELLSLYRFVDDSFAMNESLLQRTLAISLPIIRKQNTLALVDRL